MAAVRSLFLSQDAADNLVKYQFHAGEYSSLDLFLNNFWLRVAHAIPRWISPNMVTLTGLIIHVAATTWAATFFADWQWVALVRSEFTSSGMDGIAKAASESRGAGFWESYGSSSGQHVPQTFSQLCDAVPNYVYSLCAFTAWLYQTLDAADGKHARNTKQSTPLGALFDHGCDACCMLVSMIVCALTVFQSGNQEGPAEAGSFIKSAYFFLLAASFTSFYLAQWEHQHTGILPTLGVTEAQWSAIMFLIAVSSPGLRMYMRVPFELDSKWPYSTEITDVMRTLGIQDKSSVIAILCGCLPAVVCVVSLLRIFRRYYFGWLFREPELNVPQGSPWDTCAGFFIALFQACCLFFIPDVWANNWTKISALFGLTCLYLSLRSIVSGLCNCPMRGIPRTLYPVFFSVFGFIAVNTYTTSSLWRSWADRFFTPCVLAFFSTVLLPSLEQGLTVFSTKSSTGASRAYLNGLLFERATLGEITSTWSDAALEVLPPVSDHASSGTIIKALLGEPGVLFTLVNSYLVALNFIFAADVIANICRKLKIPFLAPLKEPWNICAEKKTK